MRVGLKVISALLALTALATAALFAACESDVLPTAVPTATVAIEPTSTRVPVSTYTATPEPVVVLQPTPTATGSPAATDSATPEPLPTETSTPEQVATETPTPEPVATDPATAERSPTETSTPEPVATDTATAEPLPTDTATAEPTPTEPATPQPTPTETPVPTPTAIPTPTDDEIAVERVGEFLPWYERSTRPFEFEAGDAILQLWMQNNDLGEALARLPWVNDGVVFDEAQYVKILSDVGVADPATVTAMFSFPWLADDLSSTAQYALDGLATIFGVNSGAFRVATGYPWVSDDLLESESEALYLIGQILTVDFDFGLEVLSLDWIKDGITSDESVGLYQVIELADSDVASARALLGMQSVDDGMNQDDEFAARVMRKVAETNPEMRQILSALPWVIDGVDSNDSEIRSLDFLADMANRDVELANFYLDLSWVTDDITPSELEAMLLLLPFWDKGRQFAASIANLDWIVDGVEKNDDFRIEDRAFRALESLVEIDVGLASTIAGYPWISDGIIGEESTSLEALVQTLDQIHEVNREIANALVGYVWVSDGLTEYESDAFFSLARILSDNRGSGEKLASLDWLKDGVAEHEGRALRELWTMASTEIGLVEGALTLISEGVEYDDWVVLRYLNGLAEYDAEFAGEVFEALRPFPRRLGNDALGALSHLATWEPELLAQVVERPWFVDGFDLRDVVVLAVSRSRAVRNPAFFEEFTSSPAVYMSETTLSVSGDANIWVVSNREVENHDELIADMEIAANNAESFMQVTLPSRDIVALVVQGHDLGGAFFEYSNIFLSEDRVSPEIDTRTVLHEIGHYYFNGQSTDHWLSEGGAEFLVSHRAVLDGTTNYATRLEETLERTLANCHENVRVYTIQDLIEFQDSLESGTPIGCNYDFGEYFLLGLVDIMGLSAVSDSISEFYLLSLEKVNRPSEEQLYEIILSNAPSSVQSDVVDYYRRLHGGPFLSELNYPEELNAVPEDVIVSVRESLSWAEAPADAYQAHALVALSDLWQIDPALVETVTQNEWLWGGLSRVETAATVDFAQLAEADLELARRLGEYEWFKDLDLLFWEQRAIRALRELAVQDVEFGSLALNLPWVSDELNNPERMILEDLSAAAANDPRVFPKLMGFGWLQDDLEFHEEIALATLVQIALHNAGIVYDLSTMNWLNDGISDFEDDVYVDSYALEVLAQLVRVDGALGDGVVELSWFMDGVAEDETSALLSLLPIAEGDIGRAREVLMSDWFADGVDAEEFSRLRDIADSLR